MAKITKANQQLAAAHNRALAIKLLQHHGQLSRRQLSQMIGLQNSTLSYIVRELLDKNILRTSGKRQSKTVGQKQVLLEINHELGWAAGISVFAGNISLIYYNAAGQPLARKSVAIPDDIEQLPTVLRKTMNLFLAEYDAPPGKLLGLGFGLPGIVQPETGVILKSADLNLTNYPLREKLSNEFPDVPICTLHDADAAALAENAHGSARDLHSFIYLMISIIRKNNGFSLEGYGSSIHLDGQHQTGFNHAAGEIDHRLYPKYDKIITQDHLDTLADPSGQLDDTLLDYADQLLTSLAIISNLLDPQAFVLGTNFPLKNQQLLNFLNKNLPAQLIPVPDRVINIQYAKLGEEAVCQGAALAALEQSIVKLSTADFTDASNPITPLII
ncbi:ROK family transcriptional regulator [Planctomycetota bacterium]|nr:ROK family transcriptional regulator [Planctomycetota bacterium]